MKESTRNIAVGLTGLLSVAGICVMLMLFGFIPSWVEGGYEVKAEFPNASGLNVGSRVRLNGIDIGAVRNIQLMTPPRRGVLISMRIQPQYMIPQGIRVNIESPPLGGNSQIGLDDDSVPPDAPPKFLPTDGTAVLKGGSNSLAGQVAKEIRGALQEPMKNIQGLTTRFDELITQWVAVGKNLNELVGQRTPEQVDAGQGAANVSTLVTRADERLKELKVTLAGINKWVNDPELYDHIKKTAANAEVTTGKLNNGIDKFTELADSTRKDVDTLTKRYVAVADDLSASIDSMKKAIEQASKGDGTVGKLLNDPALYNNLNDAVKRMSETMDEIKLMVEKWKKEGLPVQF